MRRKQMKRISLVLITVLLCAFAGAAMAEPKAKSTILHCGCSWDGLEASMLYGENTISAKSRGHDAHLVGTTDACYAGQIDVGDGVFQDVYTDFVRNGDDCQLDGPPLGDPIADCPDLDGPVAGDACGVVVLLQ
jgi:hypothetical protein